MTRTKAKDMWLNRNIWHIRFLEEQRPGPVVYNLWHRDFMASFPTAELPCPFCEAGIPHTVRKACL